MQYILKKEPPKRLLAAWAPLVPVDASNGGVELCAGSHRLGFLKHSRSGGFLAISGAPQLPASLQGAERSVPALQPGDVMLFTDLTLHRSGDSVVETARWSADWAYELLDTDTITPLLEAPSQRDSSDAGRPVEAAAVASGEATEESARPLLAATAVSAPISAWLRAAAASLSSFSLRCHGGLVLRGLTGALLLGGTLHLLTLRTAHGISSRARP